MGLNVLEVEFMAITVTLTEETTFLAVEKNNCSRFAKQRQAAPGSPCDGLLLSAC